MSGEVMRELFTWICVGSWLVSGQTMAQTDSKQNLKAAAVSELQKQLAERDVTEAQTLVTTNYSTRPTLTFEEIENLYVDGKITAREFQAHVNVLRTAAPPPTAQEVQEQALQMLRNHDADPAKNPPPGPAITIEHVDRTPAQASPPVERIAEDFDEIVSKVDDLIKSKEDRDKEQAEQLNVNANSGAEKAKTKRERLNDLLRLHIYGTLSKEEYEAQRALIIAEPE
jgi:hypothetical protein